MMIKALRPPPAVVIPSPADESPNAKQAREYAHALSRMRRYIGILGIALPFLLLGGDWFLSHEDRGPRGSLSAYYYSGGRELFVATLAATGIFLFAYRVAEIHRENTLTLLAGTAAVFIALFPTGPPPKDVPLTRLQELLHEKSTTGIHYVASGFFIGAMALMSWYFTRYERGHQERRTPRLVEWYPLEPTRLWWYHFSCFLGILGAIAWIGIAKFAFAKPPDRYLLYAEIVSAFAFGASWLMKGIEIDKLLDQRDQTPPPRRDVAPTVHGGLEPPVSPAP
jgi:hypothetical protein